MRDCTSQSVRLGCSCMYSIQLPGPPLLDPSPITNSPFQEFVCAIVIKLLYLIVTLPSPRQLCVCVYQTNPPTLSYTKTKPLKDPAKPSSKTSRALLYTLRPGSSLMGQQWRRRMCCHLRRDFRSRSVVHLSVCFVLFFIR